MRMDIGAKRHVAARPPSAGRARCARDGGRQPAHQRGFSFDPDRRKWQKYADRPP